MSKRYLVVRTDRDQKPFIFGELEQGRLRQGWGYKPAHDLRLMRSVRSTRKLNDEEASVWRNHRLLDTEPDGVKLGDVLLLPNLPAEGRWVLARVTGPYSFTIPPGRSDYGHVVPVEAIRDKDGKIAVVQPDNEHVDARLRGTMRSLGRMWSIDALGTAVDALIGAIEKGDSVSSVQPEAHKFQEFFAEVRAATWHGITTRYHGAEFEHLVFRLFQRIYGRDAVRHTGGAGEKGADLIVATQDPLGLEYKIAVQVKLHDGVHDDPHALEQIKQARDAHHVDAGVVVTTAESVSDRFEARRSELEDELRIDVKVVARDVLVELVMKYLGRDA